MTRKHFEAVAQALAQGYTGVLDIEDGANRSRHLDKETVMTMASYLCVTFVNINPRFNADKFKDRVWELMNQ